MAADNLSSKGQAWFCTTGLPSDVVIEVGDMSFHLHKFPLMSKSRKLHRIITEEHTEASSSSNVGKQRLEQTAEYNKKDHIQEVEEEDRAQKDEVEEEDRAQKDEVEEEARTKKDEVEEEDGAEKDEEDNCSSISLRDFPGGPEVFETVAKFCYGVKIELSSANVAPLRCAGEYLEMTEEYSEENLISKTEQFLSQSVFKSLRGSLKALISCETVTPLAEALGITDRCIDATASRAHSADPALFGWPVSEADHSLPPLAGSSDVVVWTGIQRGETRKKVKRDSKSQPWFESLAGLRPPLLSRLILAMRSRDLGPEIIESCLMSYAKDHIPGVLRSSRKQSFSPSRASEDQQREVLEIISANLPSEKSAGSSITRFLFGLLRAAIILNASDMCRSALERKIGSQLEQAALDDLLIPSYSYLNETLYDVDCVERILGHYLSSLKDRNTTEIEDGDHRGAEGGRPPALTLIGKLIDGYLAEIASDANLKSERFYNFATSLPDQARLYDDGLYRAIDVFLKSHPWITESEREKICSAMNCQKLTLEACTHAAQNERLPLRSVVQVLFFEQLQLRRAVARTLLAASNAQTPSPSPSPAPRALEAAQTLAQAQAEATRWRDTVRENQVLRLDMDSMRTRVHQLERECSSMKQMISKSHHQAGPTRTGVKAWFLAKGLGCKFRTQVCDSHESMVADRD